MPAGTRSAVELAEFQDDAVKKARKILARYDGILIGDSVGLGKTWIGKKLLEDYAYHQRMKALVSARLLSASCGRGNSAKPPSPQPFFPRKNSARPISTPAPTAMPT